VQIYQSLTSFDWDLKEIKSLKQSPEGLLAPIVYWFWLNCQYFPFSAPEQALNASHESMIEPILKVVR
jgi:hypothetical protein